ncbi:MAG: hypothetical protein U5S82_03170 [Gammaproteobacteria bacterium]|nr:hypothetical protein [Gammaproteobacteria bacterium]
MKEALEGHGASFFIDLVQETGLLRTQAEEALAELVARGLVTSDGFAGLRALITPHNRRPGFGRGRRRHRATGAAVDDGGRWSLLRPAAAALEYDAPARPADDEAVEHIAHTLLRRYGVVFRKVLEREANLPPWRELLPVYRRMEARGELRGGRFVQSFSGEQFALAGAVTRLRAVRKRKKRGDLVALSAIEPLNLVGIIARGAASRPDQQPYPAARRRARGRPRRRRGGGLLGSRRPPARPGAPDADP